MNVIAFATRPRFVRPGDTLQSLRVSPSAGALHSIDVIIIDWRGSLRAIRYNAWEHQAELLIIKDVLALQDFVHKCANILPDAQGSALVFLASWPILDASYENPNSLLWRDTGALLQTFALVTTAHRLAFCPLGILGQEIVQATDLGVQGIQSTGAAMIGRLPDEVV